MRSWLLSVLLLTIVSSTSAMWPFGSLRVSLFARTCDVEEEFSPWSECIWPKRRLAHLIDEVIGQAEDVDCKVPPPTMIKMAKRHLHKHRAEIGEHPLFKLIPEAHCGNCGRRARCCQKARSFMSQSFESQLCDDGAAPCLMDPIDDGTLEKLQEMYPDIEPSEDRCDVRVYTDRELERLKDDIAYQFVKPLFCQILGTTKPSFSCKSVGSKCGCCCAGFEFVEGEDGVGRCVSTELSPDPECEDDED